MADYPSQIRTQRTIENLPGIIYDSQKPRTLFAEDITHANDEIIAIETELGINPKAEFESVAQFLQYCKNSIDDLGDSILEQVNAAKEALFPVGSIYTNASNSTNPATLLGFGTWAAFAAGRVPVGKASSGTFATIGAEIGAEVCTLTIAEMPTHNHNVITGADEYVWSAPNLAIDYQYQSQATIMNEMSIQNKGGGNAHNNIQPSIVVYMWKRTA